MIQRLSLALCCLLALAACTPSPQVAPEEQALSETAHQLIIPWHQAFAASSAELALSLERFCQNPGNPGELEASRASWRAAMLAWQTLRPINFGPVANNNQSWRIQFWPDTHNRVGQKVEELLNQDTPITAEGLANGNVLVQGLSGLEYLLFDPGKADPASLQAPRVCEYLRAAGSNVQSVADGLVRGWITGGGNFVGTFLSAGPGNVAFPSQNEAVAALVSGMVASLEIIKNRKLGDAFGGRPGGSERINPYRLELWRSRLSLEAMQRELAAIQSLYRTGVRPLLLAGQHKALAHQMDDTFASSEKKLGDLPHPLFTRVAEPAALPQLQAAFDELGKLLSLLKRDLPAALSLQLGFNANDGD
jgi:predicted lipoprotein